MCGACAGGGADDLKVALSRALTLCDQSRHRCRRVRAVGGYRRGRKARRDARHHHGRCGRRRGPGGDSRLLQHRRIVAYGLPGGGDRGRGMWATCAGREAARIGRARPYCAISSDLPYLVSSLKSRSQRDCISTPALPAPGHSRTEVSDSAGALWDHVRSDRRALEGRAGVYSDTKYTAHP